MAIANRRPLPRLYVQDRRRQPAVLLLGVPPAVHLARTMGDQRVEVLDAVGCLEGSAQLLEQAQAVKRERLPEALIQAGRPPTGSTRPAQPAPSSVNCATTSSQKAIRA